MESLEMPSEGDGHRRPQKVIGVPKRAFQGESPATALRVHAIPLTAQVLADLGGIERQAGYSADSRYVGQRIIQVRLNFVGSEARAARSVTEDVFSKQKEP